MVSSNSNIATKVGLAGLGGKTSTSTSIFSCPRQVAPHVEGTDEKLLTSLEKGPGCSNYPPYFSGSSNFQSLLNNPTLNISTDFLTFTIHRDCHHILFKLLEDIGFQTVQDGYAQGYTYGRRRCVKYFLNQQISIAILYDRRSYLVNRPAILVTVYRPNRALITCLVRFFSSLSISPNLSKIELSLDFTCSKPNDLYNFICKHLLLKNQRKPSFFIKETFYSNDLRRCSRGTRLYIKQIGGLIFVRLELVLSQVPLRRYGVSWPPYNIDEIDIFKILSFVRFDTDYLHNILRKYYDSFSVDEPVSDEIISEVIDHLLSIPMLQAVDFLKHNHIPNYGRSLKTLDWFHDWMTAQMQKQSFLPVGEPL